MGEKLERTLSYPVILIITINSILGTGIFFLPAVGAGEAGPASIISWLILSIMSIVMAMIFAELTSMFPDSGGIYEFCKQAFGRFWSFIIGWMAIIAGNVTIAMLVVGAVRYLIPAEVVSFTISGISLPSSIIIMLLSMLFIAFFNYIAYRGMQTSATMLVVFGIITLSTIALLVIPSPFKGDVSNLVPFIPPDIDFSNIFLAVFLISETFFGLETATFLAGETKDGEKVMPKVMIRSMLIITIVTIIFVVLSLMVIPYYKFGASITPLKDLAEILYGSFGKVLSSMLVYLAILGSVAGWVVSAPRLLLAMSQDKLFLSQIGKIHPKHKTPYKAIMFQALITVMLVIFGTLGKNAYNTLLHLLLPLQLMMYAFVSVSLIVLRKKLPDKKRHYKMPIAHFLVGLLVIFYAALIFIWLTHEAHAFSIFRFVLSLILFGIPLFLLIEVYYDPKMITSINDIFAFVAVFTERLTLPRGTRKQLLELLGNITGKTLLEYGCSVGTMTIDLAKAVGPNGIVYATDASVNDLKITEKRIKDHLYSGIKTLARVHTLHDEMHFERIHPSVPYADVVVSIGAMTYIQDVQKVLKDIHNILPDGGKICFLEFSDFFKIIPNVEWMSDNNIIFDRFRKAGFVVRVHKKKGLFWNYIYVYGIKSKEEVPFV